MTLSVTYQDPAGGGLARDELAGPVFGLGHEGPLELLLVLPRRLLLFLLRIVRSELRLLAAADERARPPYQHDEQPRDERENRREQEAPPFSDDEAGIFFTDRRGSRLFLGRSHSPRARGIQSDAPCTCGARVRRACRARLRPRPPGRCGAIDPRTRAYRPPAMPAPRPASDPQAVILAAFATAPPTTTTRWEDDTG